ncbi:MAG: hypothetical protein LUI10_12285 [Lachnospiraceae bacterium]|nr:hypothetical protein [Lachnospiraceae bacterium]
MDNLKQFQDTKKNREEIWNVRLRQCLSGRGLKQKTFVSDINQKYGTNYGQKDVSRWLNVGSIQKNGVIGFPKYDTMLLIADYFNVDVGYLTGETDHDTFTMEKACLFLALNQPALQNLRDLTHPDSQSPSPWTNTMREFMNQLIGSFEFKELLAHMFDLYSLTCPYNNEHFDHFEGAMGYCQDVNETNSLYRFKAWEAFFHILDAFYPYSEIKDFLTDDE